MEIKQVCDPFTIFPYLEDIERYIEEGLTKEPLTRRLDRQNFEKMVLALLENENFGCFIALDGEGCVGHFMGILHHDLITGQLTGTELSWRVSPARNGEGIGHDLMLGFLMWARHMGCVCFAISSGNNPTVRSKMNQKFLDCGFEKYTESWRLEM